jgi:chemotaxis response regulator CheB
VYVSVPKRVLIAVDESDLRRVICSFLDPEMNVEVGGEAVNSSDFVEIAKELNPDMIVLDDSMPRMDGLDAGTDLKAMLAETPVILFPGDYSLAMQSAAKPAGVWAVVPQPEIGEFARRLEILLDRNIEKETAPENTLLILKYSTL